MEALFGHKVGAWREAAQAGRSLGEHLEHLAAGTASSSAGIARTGTLAEDGALGEPTLALEAAAVEASRGRRRWVATVGLAAALGGAGALWMWRAGEAGESAGPVPLPAVVSTRQAAIEPSRVRAAPEEQVHTPVAAGAPGAATRPAARRSSPRGRRRAAELARATPRGSARGSAEPPATARASAPAEAPTTDVKKVWDPDSIYLP